MKLSKAGEMETVFSFVVYGENGVGKTDFMASSINVPELQPSLILDCDPTGYETIKQRYPEQNVLKFDTDKKYHLQFGEIIKILKTEKIKFFCIDGISFLHNAIIDQYEKLDKTRGGYGDTDWTGINNCIKRFIMDCTKEVKMVCGTCLVDYIKNKEGNITKVRPYLSGDKFPQLFMSCFNAVARMFTDKQTIMKEGEKIEETTYNMSFSSGGSGVVKSRFHVLSGKTLNNPTMLEVWNMISKRG